MQTHQQHPKETAAKTAPANGAKATRNPLQFMAMAAQEPVQKKPENHTGLPDGLKAGVENLSGYAMDDVKVHYNSAKPAGLHTLAYAQGTEIHLGPGQEKHLPHEAWHVVQQKQGRVRPTVQLKGGVPVNDDQGLEREADVMGERALGKEGLTVNGAQQKNWATTIAKQPVQGIFIWDENIKYITDSNELWSVFKGLEDKTSFKNQLSDKRSDITNMGELEKNEVIFKAYQQLPQHGLEVFHRLLESEQRYDLSTYLKQGMLEKMLQAVEVEERGNDAWLESFTTHSKMNKNDLVDVDLDAELLKQHAKFVQQDDRGMDESNREEPEGLYEYVGRGRAYTHNIVTCTACAIQNKKTGLAFLKHVDALTPIEFIGQAIGAFFKQVQEGEGNIYDPQETLVRLFFTEGTLDDSQSGTTSLIQMIKGIATAIPQFNDVQQFFKIVEYHEGSPSHRVGPDSYINVSGETGPNIVLPFKDKVAYLLNNYAKHGVQFKEKIMQVLLECEHINFCSDSIVTAAMAKAIEQEDQELIKKLILYSSTASRYLEYHNKPSNK